VIQFDSSNAITYNSVSSEFPVFQEFNFAYPEEPYVAWLLLHKQKGSDSVHWDFIKDLPESTHTPLVMSDEEWAPFKDVISTRVRNRASQDLRLLYAYFERFRSELLSLKSINLQDSITFKDYAHSYSVIVSISQYLSDGVVLFPGLQFVHSPHANKLRVNEAGKIVVTASKDTEVGEQIFVNYGNTTTEDTIYQRGYFVERNPHDCITNSIEVRNPYWRLIAPHLFNYTGEEFTSCIPVDFQPFDAPLRHFRIIAAKSEEMDQLENVLQGKRVSIENELRMLRTLYFAVETQKVTIKDEIPDDITASQKLWTQYLQNRGRSVDYVLQRVLTLWQLYLSAEDVF